MSNLAVVTGGSPVDFSEKLTTGEPPVATNEHFPDSLSVIVGQHSRERISGGRGGMPKMFQRLTQ